MCIFFWEHRTTNMWPVPAAAAFSGCMWHVECVASLGDSGQKKVERQSKRTAAWQEFKRICSLKYVCAAHCPTYLHAHNTQTQLQQMQLQQMQLQIQQSLTTEIMQIERGERERKGGWGDSEKNNLRTKSTRWAGTGIRPNWLGSRKLGQFFLSSIKRNTEERKRRRRRREVGSNIC